MNTNISAHQIELKKIAETLINKGFSVIPVHGDNTTSHPKKPTTQWKKYQSQVATKHELNIWFRKKFTGIGIVCGSISRLFVIDFDDHYSYLAFCKNHPALAKTYTVKTRRGYHLYYKTDQKIPTQHFIGGDIKGEKSYVIAPPSIINGHRYTCISDQPYRYLDLDETARIFNYLQIQQETTITLKTTAKSTNQLSKLQLTNIYDELSSQIGRNNALYRVASIARNNHLSLTDTETALVIYHVHKPASKKHKPETQQERFTEARRTIRSAYQSNTHQHITNSGIPNSVRETLLQTQQSTILPRLLDIFRIAGYRPHQYFTMSELVTIAKLYGLNRKSVMRVLTGDLSVWNGQHIIYRSNVEYPDNRGLNVYGYGRPIEVIYRVPSVMDLLQLLKVQPSPSDVITSRDVKSAHRYRLALHREYIKRVSPEVPMSWLADRIGVNVRTIQRYNLELDVQITQNLAHFRLEKSNIDSLPKQRSKITKNATNGFWLETEDGNRFPAWRHIGSMLLKSQSNPVHVCVQRPSKLTLSDTIVDVPDVVWQSITPAEFIKLQAFRSSPTDRPTLTQVVNDLFAHVRKRLDQVRYIDLRLHFDSVTNYIAVDKVAETIGSYLYAHDADGNRVMRPARRGIAYRMLKEFGNGNVYLALLDIQTEMWYTLARHAMKFGYVPAAMKYLLSALD